MTLGVRTGRERSRWICPGCDQRIYIGEPSANLTWPAQLNLTPDQVKLLLIAAAEYRNLSEACDKCHHKHIDPMVCADLDCMCEDYHPTGDDSSVGFVDWMAVDALRNEKWPDPLIAEGAKAHNLDGGVAVIQHQGNNHRHPFPLPIQSNGARHTRGMRARTG